MKTILNLFAKVLCPVILCLFHFSILGQTRTKDLAEVYKSNADSLTNERMFEEAIIELNKALHIYTVGKNWKEKASIHNKLAEVYGDLSDPEMAKTQIDSSLLILTEREIKAPGIKADALLQMGIYFKTILKLDNSADTFSEALKEYEKVVPIPSNSLAKVNFELAMLSAMKSDFSLSRSYLESMKNELEKAKLMDKKLLSKYYDLQGRLASANDNAEKAVEMLKHSLEILYGMEERDEMQIAKVEKVLGGIYYNNRNYSEARDIVSKVLPKYRKLLGEDHIDLNTLYSLLARIYSRLGEYDKALDYNNASIALIRGKFGDENRRFANAYNALAITYDRMGRYDEATEFYLKSLHQYKLHYGAKYRQVINIYTNLGRIQRIQTKYEDAIKNIEKSLSLKKELYGPDHLSAAFSYQHLGETYVDMGQFELALKNLQKALELRKLNYGPKHWEVGLSYLSLGEYHERKKEYKKAIDYLNIGLKMYHTELKNTVKDSVSVKYEILFYLYDCLIEKGNNYQKLYNDTENMIFLDSTMVMYDKADALSFKIREQISAYGDKLKLSEKVSTEMANIVEALWAGYERSKDDDLKQKMFYYFQRDKANTLFEITNNFIKKSTKGFSAIADKENTLKVKIAELESGIRTAENKNRTVMKDSLENICLSKKLELDSLKQYARLNYPSYHQTHFKNDYLTIKELQNHLDGNLSVVEYFVQEGTTYALVLTKTEVVIKKLPVPGLNKRLNDLELSIGEKNTEDFKRLASGLYADIVHPLANYLVGDEMIIIPHKELWNLDFELLLTKTEVSNNPQDLPYLLKDYSISYLPSSVFFEIKSDDTANITANDDCLAFSYSSGDEKVRVAEETSFQRFRNSKEDLPGTRREIREISKVLKGDYYYGTAASESVFKKVADNYNILHLALHGEVDHENPDYSRLFFTPEEGGGENDGFLYTYEISNMELNSEMVVLSACDTGKGKLAEGEGVLSLGNAFQHAGAKSLLLSRRKVSDAIAPEIMGAFYENLKKGMNKPRALRLAKLEFLESANVNQLHPYYWSSFYLLGNSEALSLESDFNGWLLLWAIPILILVWFFGKRKLY